MGLEEGIRCARAKDPGNIRGFFLLHFISLGDIVASFGLAFATDERLGRRVSESFVEVCAFVIPILSPHRDFHPKECPHQSHPPVETPTAGTHLVFPTIEFYESIVPALSESRGVLCKFFYVALMRIGLPRAMKTSSLSSRQEPQLGSWTNDGREDRSEISYACLTAFVPI